jgi:Predicted membrane protein
MSDQPEDYSRSQISEARRRRRSHGYIPTTKGDRAVFMAQLSERLVANADFYLFSLLCGVVLAAAILLDNPAIYILAALLAPFMAPVVGLGFASVVGSLRFFVQSMGSLAIGGLLVFLMGLLGGWISKLFPNLQLTQAHFHVNFSIPDFILLTIGIVLAIYLTVKAPKSRSLVASVALAYEIYIPISLAGFGITSGFQGLFPEGLEIVGLWLAWVIFAGTIFLTILKIRPTTIFGYLLTAVLLAAALYGLLSNSAIGSTLKSQLNANVPTPTAGWTAEPSVPQDTVAAITGVTLTPTLTPAPGTISMRESATPTNTLVPTDTATVTITPKPTPLYAQTYSSQSDGVVIRKTAGGDYLALLKVNTLVEILDTTDLNGRIWVHIRVVETGQEGWIVQSLLMTATPSPQW